MSIIFAPFALGIGAASFASGASKDIAESPTAVRSGAGTPKKESNRFKKRLESLSKSQSLLSYKIYRVLILLQVGLSVRMLCTTS